VSPNKRLLLLLVATALADVRQAINAEAHAARQSVPQGGQGAPRSSGSGQMLDAASDAHSPGTGRVP
jgi:hypothetical protein